MKYKMSKGFRMFLILFTVMMIYPVICKFKGVDPRLQPYADELERFSGMKLDNANFGSTPETAIGQCNVLYSTITINEEKWNTFSHENKIIILAHEGLHCLKGANHVKDWGKGLCPKSIMYPMNMGGWCSKAFFDDYMEEVRTWKN